MSAAFAAKVQLKRVALQVPHELASERRLRGDHKDGLAFVFDFRAARTGANKIVSAPTVGFEDYKCADTDWFSGLEIPGGEAGKLGEGLGCFFGGFGLTDREVGGFEPAGVVFILCLVLLIGGFGVGRQRGLSQHIQFGLQPGDDSIKERTFVHEGTIQKLPAGERRARFRDTKAVGNQLDKLRATEIVRENTKYVIGG